MACSVAEKYRLDEDRPIGLDEARRLAEQLATSQYENFTVVSWMLPKPLRQHFYNVYAYCRVSDDLADEVGDTATSLDLLDRWRTGLHAMYAGRPDHWVFTALADTVAQFDIPADPFDHLLDAFVQDQRQPRYETYDDLLGYCVNSANPVGQLVLYLGGYRDAERFALSDHTCTALQLTNFWQDVARDWDKGRVYLPLEDMRRFGVTEEQIAQRRFTAEYRDLLAFECARAKSLFDQGARLLDMIDGHVRRDVALFTAGGVAILRRIEAAGYDTLSSRPTLGKAGKVMLMLRVLLGGQPWR
ncbi:MAG: squalene synthase HpnC [Armatimonadetes bacterium]|nr:squalene synthase HpnC [Armatimonadota bacterium]